MAFQAATGDWVTMSLGVSSFGGGAAPISNAATLASKIERILVSPFGAGLAEQ